MPPLETLGELEVSVSEFVELLNQTLDFAYPSVIISGELANYRISKNRWVYFDLKDESATVRFFGTVYQLPGPLENGMLLKVRGQPRLHNLYGFSVNIQTIQPTGEGSIRKAAELLKAKLKAEGLFDELRKRPLPYPPSRIGLITSAQSAAYADFIKIMKARWQGVDISLIDVQVQGEVAPAQIVQAVEHFNAQAEPPEVLILIRGGGSAEDLAAFSTEQVTRAVAASRVPTLVAIGHEIDLSLAELAADKRASTPSNAAELLVPDRDQVIRQLETTKQTLREALSGRLRQIQRDLKQSGLQIQTLTEQRLERARQQLQARSQMIAALSPEAILRRGYAIVRLKGKVLRSVKSASEGVIVKVQLTDGSFSSTVIKKAKN